ncbi:uncharacterized protein [Apostichopus japonicus]|uniref:uncharacterized protein n=1 Tax=Stichopus japonicus TaxID=307972 RepID=UPI003AB836A7
MSFHADRCGKNITLFDNGTIASRENPTGASYTTFGQGVTFTNSPIDLNSPIIVEILAVDPSYSGTLCIGLTNQDPASFKRLPTSSVPDFMQKTGNWGVSLENSLRKYDWVTLRCEEDKSVSLCTNDVARVTFKEAEDNIDFAKPVWGIIDVYGSVTKVRLIIPKATVSSNTCPSITNNALNEALLSSRCLAPLDVRLVLLGDDSESVRFIKKGLIRQQGSGDSGNSTGLACVTFCEDWIPKLKRNDIERLIEIACAECVTFKLKETNTEAKNSLEPIARKIHIDEDLESRILRRVQFKLLKTANDVTEVTAEDEQVRSRLSIWEFSQECLSKSLHEVFMPAPITNPMTVLYIVNYDTIDIKQDKPRESLFLHQFHNTLRMIFTRVLGASEETNEPVHKQYLSPPVIVVGIYDEKKLVDGQIEKIESLIRSSLEEKVYQPHVISLYHAIPHQELGEMDSKSTKMIDDLRKHINRVADGELETGTMTPVWYHVLQMNLMKKRDGGVMSLSPPEVDTLCTEMNKTLPDIKKALHYVNEAGDALTGYNSDGPYVFLEPIKTLDATVKAVTVVDPSERWSTHDRMWTKLNKEGVLSENLLSHMWKECIKEKDSLLDFMKFHHLLYDITGKNEKTRQFLIPSLLPNPDPVETPSSDDVILFVDFAGCMPEYIFTELCISIRQWTIENDWGGSRLTKGHCHFDIEEDTELTLTRCTFDQSVLGVYITSSGGSSRPKAQTVCKIKDEIQKQLNIKTSNRCFKSTFSVKCPVCDNLVDVDACLRKSSVTCQNNHKIQTSSIQSWFKDSTNAEASCAGKDQLLTDILLTEISAELGQEWKALGRMLGLTKEDLYHIQADNNLSVGDQIYEMLAKWRDTSGTVDERKKLDILTQALEADSVDQGKLADVIKEKLNIE